MFNLKNKVAIVTGASKGIGKSIAQKISQAGTHTVCVSRSKDILMDISKKMKSQISSNVRLEVIEDAGHFFRDLVADELADIISGYIATLDK